ncbi:MAG TPA: decaprenyl-phosphate phosphoribosyltransferase [Longimicrobiales bacterium]
MMPPLTRDPPAEAQSPAAAPRTRMRRLTLVWRSLRPRQWLKNLVVVAPLVFAERLEDPAHALRAAIALVIFCAISGAVYLFNDLVDREADRRHPGKRTRPLASGALTPGTAIGALALLLPLSFAGAALLDALFALVCAAYLLANIGYTLVWKHVVILDIFLIAAGFVLRGIGGAAALDVAISPWLLLCTLFLALFLAAGKRRHELVAVRDAAAHRPILAAYSAVLIDQLIAILAAVTVSTYALYTIAESTRANFGTERLAYTIPFVLFGIFRYLYLVYQEDGGGHPEEALLTDRPLLISVLLWGLTAVVIIYVLD